MLYRSEEMLAIINEIIGNTACVSSIDVARLSRQCLLATVFFLLSCSDEPESLDTRTPEEREEALMQRKEELAARWIAHEAKQKAREGTSAEVTNTPTASDDTSKTIREKAVELKGGLMKTAQDVKEKSAGTMLVIESIDLLMDMEAEALRQDFAKAKLEVVEVGNHLECALVSTGDDFTYLPAQSYEVEWWYQGVKVTKKASQYCSGATLGIGLSPGPSCPHHIKGAFYPYMATNYNQARQDDDQFQCGLSFAFSMNAAIQKHLADNPFPRLKSEPTTWRRWTELKEQRGGPWDFKGTVLDCGTDGPQGHRCHLIEEER